MRIESDIKLDFDDVLLKPKRSQLTSRSDVVLSREMDFANRGSLYCFPVIAANMLTTGTFAMAKGLAKHNMLTALHKHYTEQELVDFFVDNYSISDIVFYTLGANDKDFEKLLRVTSEVETEGRARMTMTVKGLFPKLIMIDVANGYQEKFVDFVKKVREAYPKSIIAAGNVVTAEMTQQLIISGADIVKVGIGSGGVCTTRLVAGVGMPQLSAVIECADAAHGLGGRIISDGGIIHPGDVAKAFAANADFVMIGSYFAGTDECDCDIVKKDGKKYLKHFGMSSKEAMDKLHGGVASHRASEGKTVLVESKGPVDGLVQEIKGGVASACCYSGAKTLKDLPKCATFIRCNKTHNKVYEK